MQKYKLKYLAIIIASFGWFSAIAQDPMALYYLENVPQSNFVNPAMAPRANGFIGIPGVNSIYFNFMTDLSSDVLFQQTDSGTSSLLSADFDYNYLYKKIGDGANLRTYELISPLSFGFKTRIGYFTFAMSEKVKMNMFIPSDFFKITERGFPAGSDFELANMGLDAQLYSEYAFGYSREITERLTLGARIKVLQGLASIKSDIETANLHTEQDVWNLDLQGSVYSSGLLDVTKNEDGTIDSIRINEDFKNFDAVEIFKKYGTNFKNMGVAIDIGAIYQLNKDWSLSASLNDLGFISWKDDLNSVHFNGKYDFLGLEINNDNVDSIGTALGDLIDTIKTVVNYHAGNSKFRTSIGTQLHIGAEYQINHVFSAGFLSRSILDRNYFHQEFNLSANLNLYKILTANLNYNISIKGENYLGLGLALRGGPLQFYLLLDHIPFTYTNYVVNDGSKIPGPNEIRAFNVMLGLNIILGAHGYKDEPKIDAYSDF